MPYKDIDKQKKENRKSDLKRRNSRKRKEYLENYRKLNRDKFKISTSKWRNTENGKKINAEYYRNNKDKIKETMKKYDKRIDARYKKYKNNAKRRGIIFNISFEIFENLLKQVCTYCRNDDLIIGVDRINNELGYIDGNVTPCCKICNRMKSNMKKDEFIEHCIKIWRVAVLVDRDAS